MMYKVLGRILLSVLLLTTDFLSVYTQIVQSTPSTQNVIVNMKNFIKPEEIASTLGNKNKSEKSGVGAGYYRTARAKTSTSMRELFDCAVALDASCLVDRAEDIVDNANTNLLQQADIEARKISFGRASTLKGEENSTPSTLITSIAKMVLELPELLRDSISGMLRTGKFDIAGIVGDDDDEEEEDSEDAEKKDANAEDDDDEGEGDDDNEGEETSSEDNEAEETEDTNVEAKSDDDMIFVRKKCGKQGLNCLMDDAGNVFQGFGDGTARGSKVGDPRGKKKKKKKAIIKLLLLGLVLKAKITLLLKMLAAKLQIKFLLIAMANLLINLARFWWDLKKGGHHEPQKVIYYEHAQHQHHYDGGEDWQSGPGGGGGGSYWGRSYDEEEENKSAQDMAYAKQIPKGTIYSRVSEKPNISWNAWG